MRRRSVDSFLSSRSQARSLRTGFATVKGAGISQIFSRARIWLCLTEGSLLFFKDSTSHKPISSLSIDEITDIDSDSSKTNVLRILCSRHKDIILTFKSAADARLWCNDLEQCLHPVLCIGDGMDVGIGISNSYREGNALLAITDSDKNNEPVIALARGMETEGHWQKNHGVDLQRSRSPKRNSKDSAFTAFSGTTFALTSISGSTRNNSQTSLQSDTEISKQLELDREYAEFFTDMDTEEEEMYAEHQKLYEGHILGIRPPSPVDPELVFGVERVYISVSGFPTSPRDDKHIDDLTGKVDKLYEHPSAVGGYSDVWKGRLRPDRGGQTFVAIKVIRAFAFEERHLEKVRRRLDKELDIWRRLQHPNIVPLLGTVDDFGKFQSMISPWFPNGNAGKYFEKLELGQSLSSRLKLLYDVASGLEYLHSFFPPIVHGDLKASNVLVSEEGEAMLTDFGISRVFEEANEGSHSASSFNGSVRWMAVELIRGFVTDKDSLSDSVQINTTTDVWAFGSTVLEILSGKPPYVYRKRDEHVMHEIWNGLLPLRDANRNLYPNVTEKIASFLYKCWNEVPAARPSITEAKAFIYGALRERRRMGVVLEDETSE